MRCYAEGCAWQQHAILKLATFLTFLLMKYVELILCRQVLENVRALVLNDFQMESMGLTGYESRCDLSPWLNLIRRRSHSIGMGHGVTELNHHLPRAWLRWSLLIQFTRPQLNLECPGLFDYNPQIFLQSIPEATPSKVWVCGSSIARNVGLNPYGCMDICLLGLLCVVR